MVLLNSYDNSEITTCMIQANNIHKTFQTGDTSLHVLKGVNLSVRHGEFLSIMGKSGSGKSTLLHIIGCLDLATAGEYTLGGIDVFSASDAERSRLRANQIGFVFQTFNLLGELSVFENVELPFLYRSNTTGNNNKKIYAAIDMVGLTNRIHHRANELSGGEMQRAAIARALVINPTIILADEPTGNLDSTTTHDILSLFAQLHSDQNTTIIIITHDDEVVKYSQRMVILQDGLLSSCDA